eukprot:sb/3469630/
MNRRRVGNAEMSLRKLAGLNKVVWEGLQEQTGRTENREHVIPGIGQQLRTLVTHRVLFLETVAQMVLWVVIYTAYYGINYAWDKLVPDPSLGYILAMSVQLTAYVIFTPAMRLLGRKRYMTGSFVLAALFLAAGMSTITLGSDTEWTVASVASILAQFFISGTYAGICLWNVELPPCTHTGTVVVVVTVEVVPLVLCRFVSSLISKVCKHLSYCNTLCSPRAHLS